MFNPFKKSQEEEQEPTPEQLYAQHMQYAGPMPVNVPQEDLNGNPIEDLYVLLDIGVNDVVKSVPMNKHFLKEYILNRFEEQPLKYFNNANRLKIVHLKSGLIKSVSIKLDV